MSLLEFIKILKGSHLLVKLRTAKFFSRFCENYIDREFLPLAINLLKIFKTYRVKIPLAKCVEPPFLSPFFCFVFYCV